MRYIPAISAPIALLSVFMTTSTAMAGGGTTDIQLRPSILPEGLTKAACKDPRPEEDYGDLQGENNTFDVWQNALEYSSLQIGCYQFLKDQGHNVSIELDQSIRELQNLLNSYAVAHDFELDISVDGIMWGETSHAYLEVAQAAEFFAPFFEDAYDPYLEADQNSYMQRFVQELDHYAGNELERAKEYTDDFFNNEVYMHEPPLENPDFEEPTYIMPPIPTESCLDVPRLSRGKIPCYRDASYDKQTITVNFSALSL